jgi:dipeptidase
MNDVINQSELTRRALQEAIERARQAIEQMRDLIERTRAIRSQADPILGTVASGAPIKRAL